MRPLTLDLLPDTFAIARLDPQADLPGWVQGGDLASITRTPSELSIVCESHRVPSAILAEREYRCLRVLGPLQFSATGVLESLARPLAESAISIFALSTYDTDYVLVAGRDLERAVACLLAAGHDVRRTAEA